MPIGNATTTGLTVNGGSYFTSGLNIAGGGLAVVGATSLQNATATNGFAVSGSSFNVNGQNLWLILLAMLLQPH